MHLWRPQPEISGCTCSRARCSLVSSGPTTCTCIKFSHPVCLGDNRFMSRNSKNFLVAYALLVALPVAGLLGVLKHGHGLAAPLSVDGVWKLQLDASQLAALPCGKALLSGSDAAMTIAQSGKNFTLSFANAPKASAGGAIEGSVLKASVSPPSADIPCGGALNLVATVDPHSEPRSLVGTISASDCPSCSPVEVQATRQAQPRPRRPH